MSARDIAELEAELAAEVQQRQALLLQIEDERKRWQNERAEMLEEMAEEAAERRRLLQQQNSEREKHKQERLKLIYQVEALMGQVNELDLKLEAAEAKSAPVAPTAGERVEDKGFDADKGSAASAGPMSAGHAATDGGDGKPLDVGSRGPADALSSVQ